MANALRTNKGGQQPLRWWERALQAVAGTRIGAWFYVHVATHVDRYLLPRTRGRIGLAMTWPSLLLTTTGARTGQPRRTPLVYLADRDRIILVASNGGRPRHPAWYHNLRAQPRVQLTIRGRTATYLAREADGAERAELWRKVVDMYAGYEAYQRRANGRRIPVVVLTPAQPGQ